MNIDNDAFRIEWDLHELGDKPAEPLRLATRAGLSPREFARAIAMGAVPPANLPDLSEDEAA